MSGAAREARELNDVTDMAIIATSLFMKLYTYPVHLGFREYRGAPPLLPYQYVLWVVVQ